MFYFEYAPVALSTVNLLASRWRVCAGCVGRLTARSRGGFCRPFAVQKGRGDAWVTLTLRPGSEPLFAKIEPSLAELEEAITP